ncbi:MAG: hypothetical protein ABH885_01870, partial [Candidatus Omnitrophota bacterium]
AVKGQCMQEDPKTVCFKFEDYDNEGFYLIFKDSTRLALTREGIEKAANDFWADSGKMPPALKAEIASHKCEFCPLGDSDEICQALRPILPLVGILDIYLSHDEVVTVCKGGEKGLLHVADATMQDAFKAVSIMSLMNYCTVGRKYGKYFHGVTPFMRSKDVAIRLYLNIHWFHGHDKAEMDGVIARFKQDITAMCKTQVKLMNIICKKDILMNAFVVMAIIMEFFSMDMKKMVMESFENFGKRNEPGG